MIYLVNGSMPVSMLRLQISELLEQPFLVHLLVGVSWEEDILQHSGTISDRVFPGTTIPCPYLQRGSRVLVYFTRPANVSPVDPEPVPVGLSSLDIAPEAGGWASEYTKAAIRRVISQESSSSSSDDQGISSTARPPASRSSFFDDAYVKGKHTPVHVGGATTLNPIHRASPTYSEVYTATLTTLTDIERHEQRIYHPGYTPTAIRKNIRSMLRNSDPSQHMVDFQEKDIPPADRDERTYRVLTDLLRDRDRVDQDFFIPVGGVAVDGSALGAESIQEAYTERDQQYNRLNRRLYQTYAASAYIIHDRIFLSYCRPALRNLPIITAFKLEKLKQSLRDNVMARPPYTTVQQPRMDATQPVFTAPKPSYADALRPRAEWMKHQPPFVSEEEADNTWRQGNKRMFGVERSSKDNLGEQTTLTTPQLEKRISDLQYELYLRTETQDKAHRDSTLPFNSLAARVFRQGRKSDTSDEKQNNHPDQSKTSEGNFFQAKEAVPRQKTNRPIVIVS
jgi:hypothetical protein